MTRRRTLATLGLTAVAATAVLAAPTGGTQAQWRETRTTTAPALRMGSVSLSVKDSPVAKPFTDANRALLTNASGFGLEYAPTQLTVSRYPDSPTTGSDVSGLLGWGKGPTYDYWPDCSIGASPPGRWGVPQTAGNGATSQTYPVLQRTGSDLRAPLLKDAKGQSLCLVVRPDIADWDRYKNFAGREYLLSTTFAAASVNASWTANPAPVWNSRWVIPLPGAKLPSGAVCGNGLINNVRVFWGWPDSSTTAATGYSAVDHWDVLWRPRGSTTPWRVAVAGVRGNDRNQWVGTSNVGSYRGPVEFMVRAYPFADSPTRYADSEVLWYATAPGSSGGWGCDSPATVPNPDAGMYGY